MASSTVNSVPHETDKAEARKRIEAMDLTRVWDVTKKTHELWTDCLKEQAMGQYRDFLYVCWHHSRHQAVPATGLAVPNPLVDAMWHSHMVLPAQYDRDCSRLLGPNRILDHDPNFDETGKVTAALRAATVEAYRQAVTGLPSGETKKCQWMVVDRNPS